jgi:MFS family permease
MEREQGKPWNPYHPTMDLDRYAEPNTRWLDQSEIRTQQALGPLVLMVAYVIDDWRLVAVQGGFLLLTALYYGLGPYVLLYRRVLKPLRVVKPDLRSDNAEPHRFAAMFGFSVLSVAVYLLETGHATVGWMLVWAVGILGGIAFFGWCAGCFMYYVINRVGVGGFFRHAPVDAMAFPGVRPPRSGGR